MAAVTGAASGLGRALALRLAAEGRPVALCDVDAEGLEETHARCAAGGVEASARVVDVAQADAVFAWADDVVARHGSVHAVFNNAGATVVATVRNLELAELAWLMDLNFHGVVHGTKAFLPHLEAGGGGHVVNLSSAFGFIGNPGQAAYTASKFAVRGFTEALALELAVEGSPVRAHVVHPGGTATAIARNARFGARQETELPRAEMEARFDRVARTSADAAAGDPARRAARPDPDRRRCGCPRDLGTPAPAARRLPAPGRGRLPPSRSGPGLSRASGRGGRAPPATMAGPMLRTAR